MVLATFRLSGLKGRGRKPKVLVWVVRRVKMPLTEMEKSGGGGGVRGGIGTGRRKKGRREGEKGRGRGRREIVLVSSGDGVEGEDRI